MRTTPPRARRQASASRVTVWRFSIPPEALSRRERLTLIALSDPRALFDRRGRLKRLDRLPPANHLHHPVGDDAPAAERRRGDHGAPAQQDRRAAAADWLSPRRCAAPVACVA